MKLTKTLFQTLIRGVAPLVLITLFISPFIARSQSAIADEHIVSTQALQQQVSKFSEKRKEDIATVQNFMSSSVAERAMKEAKMDPVQVRTAIPVLSNEELSNLSARVCDAQQKIAAGSMGPGFLTLIVIALAVIIIVAIVH
jgi:hypothetical protein